MNLLVGATGILGSEICRRLTAEGKPTRALVRSTSDPAKVDRLREYGAEIVQGDLRDRASLEIACQGVTAVISTVSSMPRSYQPGENDIQTVDLPARVWHVVSRPEDSIAPGLICRTRCHSSVLLYRRGRTATTTPLPQGEKGERDGRHLEGLLSTDTG